MTRDEIRHVVERTAQSRYWRKRDAEIIVAAMAHTGMTVSAFAREFGICVQRLRRWKQVLAGEGALAVPSGTSGAPSAAFHAVHVVVDEPEDDKTFELVLRGGRRIAVRADFDESSLERLVRFTERLGC